MKKLALAMAIVGTLCSFTAFGKTLGEYCPAGVKPGAMTGVEVPFEALTKLGPNMFFIVITDENGVGKLIKVDHESIPLCESMVKIPINTVNAAQPQGGCWIRLNGMFFWFDPCP